MCRLFAFRTALRSTGHRSLIAAENALGRQSARHPDGWGIGYYVGDYPHLYRNPAQALQDGLFRDLGSVVSAYTLIGHIRKASVGSVNLLNCHPFQFGNWMMAHNGEIAGYDNPEVQAAVLALVAPKFQPYILGTTDSEVIFYAFLSRLSMQFEDLSFKGLPFNAVADALQATVDDVIAIIDQHGTQLTKLNLIVTNGKLLIGHRYRLPLHLSTWKRGCPERERCPLFLESICENPVDTGPVRHLVLASEPISEAPDVWEAMNDRELVGVDWGMVLHRQRHA
jgi:glutamine amidotransferase